MQLIENVPGGVIHYFELTKRCSSDSFEKLSASLYEDKVDLNPHQTEAALFAFRSSLSKGAILAEEAGLGKRIEAGIVLSQKWAERKILIIVITVSISKTELLLKYLLAVKWMKINMINKKGFVH